MNSDLQLFPNIPEKVKNIFNIVHFIFLRVMESENLVK